MTYYGDLLSVSDRRPGKASRYRPIVLLLVPLAAILFQVYVPIFFTYLGYLELPLLVTVYFAVMRRRPIPGLLYGAGIGLVQDALSPHPLGMFGIVKTLVGYAAASLSVRLDVGNPAARFIVAGVFFLAHQFLYWVLARTLMGAPLRFDLPLTIVTGFMNGAVAVPFFHLLDKLKETG